MSRQRRAWILFRIHQALEKVLWPLRCAVADPYRGQIRGVRERAQEVELALDEVEQQIEDPVAVPGFVQPLDEGLPPGVETSIEALIGRLEVSRETERRGCKGVPAGQDHPAPCAR